MGILRKGILSAPSGAVGKIVGYRKNGKDIIAKKSVNGGDIDKMWQGMWRKLEPQAIEVFDNLFAAWKTSWNVSAPPGMSGLDYFLQWNKAKLGQYRRLNFDNLTGSLVGLKEDPPIFAWLSNNNETVNIKYMEKIVFPTPGILLRFTCGYIDLQGFFHEAFRINNPIAGQIFQRSVAHVDKSNLRYFYIATRQFNDTYDLNSIYIDLTANRLHA